MPIPTQLDHQLAEIDDLGAGLLVTLRTMRWSHTDPEQLRLRLQEFCDRVIDCANEIVASRDNR
jgi:hypothetical protein